MRDIALRLFLLVGIFFSPVAGYLGRAAAEQMSYWYIYVLEGELGRDATTRTVAPGCAAWAATAVGADLLDTSDSSKCSLKGFLKYLWAPQVFTDSDGNPVYKNQAGTQYTNADGSAMSLDDILANERPELTVKPLKQNEAWRSVPLSKVYTIIYMSRYYDGTDPNRLLPGSGGSYWTARSQVTATLPAIEAQYPEDDSQPKAYQNMRQLIAQTKLASKTAYLIRLLDFEKHRLGEGLLQARLQSKLGGRIPIIRTKTLSTNIGAPSSFNALDADATRAANAEIENFDALFLETCQEYRADDPNHWTALQSARQALEVGNCDVPGGGTLKRSIV